MEKIMHRFIIADVFTDQPFSGNQLAVFPDAQGLSDRAMQAIAREFNFPETTFVLPPWRVRIFTPKAELPFAGIRRWGLRLFSQESKKWTCLGRSFSKKASALCRSTLRCAARPRGVGEAFQGGMVVSDLLLQRRQRRLRAHVRAAYGIEEDAATGSAAVALAGVLAARRAQAEGIFAWRIEQGVAMGRPSKLEATAEKHGGRVARVKVGGTTVVSAEGTMNVPPGY